MPRNTPSVHCVARSRTKLTRIRGENWVEASGMGFVANIKGQKSHDIIVKGIGLDFRPIMLASPLSRMAHIRRSGGSVHHPDLALAYA